MYNGLILVCFSNQFKKTHCFQNLLRFTRQLRARSWPRNIKRCKYVSLFSGLDRETNVSVVCFLCSLSEYGCVALLVQPLLIYHHVPTFMTELQAALFLLLFTSAVRHFQWEAYHTVMQTACFGRSIRQYAGRYPSLIPKKRRGIYTRDLSTDKTPKRSRWTAEGFLFVGFRTDIVTLDMAHGWGRKAGAITKANLSTSSYYLNP